MLTLFKRRGSEKAPEPPPKPARREDSLNADLRDHLYTMYRLTPPQERRKSHWVMSAEWLMEVHKIEAGGHGIFPPSSDVETILGLPVEVRDDAGAPDLVMAGA